MPIRVLQIVTVMNRGGEETMIMNYYRNLNLNEIQFDFLVHRDEKGVYEDEILRMGGRIYRAFPVRPWNYSKYQKWLNDFFERHKGEYAAVHAHILENCGFAINAAEKAGVPIRITHSHLAQAGIDYKYLFRKYGKIITNRSSVTTRLACGIDAGKYLYDDHEFEVLPNAVDTKKYRFNSKVREEARNEFSIRDEVIIGNVARFHPVKNQAYLVDIFEEYHKLNQNSKLIMVGIGEELENVRNKVVSLGLSDSVIFTGLRNDVDRVLQAFDIIVFPSKLEGLPLSLIEAQAAGLPCLLSDRVAQETAITNLVQFEKLESSPECWAERINEMLSGFVRQDMTETIKKSGYDIENNTVRLFDIYSGRG